MNGLDKYEKMREATAVMYADVEKNLDEKVNAFTATIYTEPGVAVGLSFVLPVTTLRRLLPGLAMLFGVPDVSFVDYDGS